jgi:hypothetical protein
MLSILLDMVVQFQVNSDVNPECEFVRRVVGIADWYCSSPDALCSAFYGCLDLMGARLATSSMATAT